MPHFSSNLTFAGAGPSPFILRAPAWGVLVQQPWRPPLYFRPVLRGGARESAEAGIQPAGAKAHHPGTTRRGAIPLL